MAGLKTNGGLMQRGRKLQWEKPLVGCVKFNIDGAWNFKSLAASLGVICRHWN